MKKEITWNISLLLLGILLVLGFTYNSYHAMGSWEANSSSSIYSIENKIKLGLILGVVLIVFRYIHVAILSISNKDLKLIVLLIGYTFPILIVLFLLYSPMGTTGTLDKYGILRLNNEKAWKGDDSEFIVEGNRAYVKMIRDFSYISKGSFEATQIKEVWKTKDSIEVSFTTKGEAYTIYPIVNSDWADIDGVVKYINNQVLDDVDFKFYGGPISDTFIIGLTEEERESLEKEIDVEFREIK